MGCELIRHPAIGTKCTLVILNEIIGKLAPELIDRTANVLAQNYELVGA